MLPDFLTGRRSARIWLWAGLATALFFAWFAVTIDWATLRQAIAQTGAGTIAVVMALLTVNCLMAALWLMVIVRGKHRARGAFEVIAWQFLAASILPARLGDLAWIYLIHKKLNTGPGRAVFIALYHRLLDFIVSSLFFLLAVLAAGAGLLGANIVLLAGVVFALLLAIFAFLEQLLTVGARLLQWAERRMETRLVRVLLSQLLHVRVWYRHALPQSIKWATFAIIAVRWIAILAALAALIHAMGAPLDWIDSMFLANVYNYFSIVPLQTIGGFGAGEAGLAWILTLYGLTLGKASAIALLIRMLINLQHILLWLVITGTLAIRDAFAGAPARL